MKDNVKILIVDDQAGVRRLIAETLKEDNYEVHLAASGLEALAAMQKMEPAIVLLDMKMPGMSGLEVIQEMKRLNLKSTIVLMTAYGELDMVNQAKKLGVVNFLPKPFDINEMRMMVAGLMSAKEIESACLKIPG
ncbi:response regulator [Zhaonella formicivorans]|uniref:response regulator n=1 Tax=Zhaonella formicivorans TaxID=2528593 RepID=UPI0010E1D3BF|nr:response regulator [Zhaonella formicivorans]